MDPISIALGLSQFVPSIVRWIGGDKAGDVAQQVVNVARGVTGANDGDSALAALKANPQLALQYQQQMLAFERDMYAEDTKRLVVVNQTIQAEAASSDPYVRRMRPTFGYIMAITWAATMLAVAKSIVVTPTNAPTIIAAVSQLTGLWGIGLAVLGVYVYKRSDDKKANSAGLIKGL